MSRAAAGKEGDVDIRTEMRIALFWRALIGDLEYIRYNPDDMLRWYMALELRGPEEIRDLVSERYTTRPMPVILGVVNKAPHPPSRLVREWLAYHEHKVRTGVYWFAPLAFCVLCGLVFPMVYGCQNLRPLNPLVMKPPNNGMQAPTSVALSPSYGTSPSFIPPLTGGPTGTVTIPANAGNSGGPPAAAPTAGVTGPANIGASGAAGGPP
jgi:hypothetical protein